MPRSTAEWQPIETAPRDGTHFLAWGVLIADEEDEQGYVIRRGVRHENVHVVYWLKIFGPGSIVEFPFRTGTYGKPDNLTFTHWMPEPAGPGGRNSNSHQLLRKTGMK